MKAEEHSDADAMQPAEAEPSVKHTVAKETTIYFVANMITQAVGILTGFFTRRYLGPGAMGVWRLIMTFKRPLVSSGLGVMKATLREIPYYRGAGDEEKAEEVKNVGFSFVVLMSIVAGLAVAAVALVFRSYYPEQHLMFSGLLILAILLVLERVNNSYTVLLRANKRFIILSALTVFQAVFMLAAVLLIVRPLKFHGMLIAAPVSAICGVVFMHLLARYRIRPSLKTKTIAKLIKIGLPWLAFALLFTILRSIDFWMIGMFLRSYEKVGHYDIAVKAGEIIYSFANTFGIVMFPRFQERYGAGSRDAESIRGYLTKAVLVMTYLLPVLIGGFYIVMPPVVEAFLEKYIPGLSPMKFFFVGTYFISLVIYPTHFLITVDSQRKLVPAAIGAIITSVILNYWFIQLGWGIEGVAAATALTMFLYWVAVMACVAMELGSLRKAPGMLATVLLPFFYFLVLLFGLHILVNTGASFTDATYRLVGFIIFAIPPLWYVNRQTGVLTIVWDIVRKRGGDNKNNEDTQ